tara:strand:- start:3075 stop:5258 length:2184 start_codon:yes stop_codon:yes gene_type:complete
MAIDPRIQYKFRSDRGTYYRITIIDTISSTSSLYDDVFANDDGFKLTYETNDDDRFTGLIPSKVQIGFFIDDDSGGGNPTNIISIVNSIRKSNYKRWQIKIENSTDDSTYYLFWTGNFLNDINVEEDISLPREIKLTAICGLGALDNIPFNEEIDYNLNFKYTCYRYIFNSLTIDVDTENNWESNDLFIRTVVDWTNSVITRDASTDPLNSARFQASAFAPVDDNGVRKPKTAFLLLNNICKAFGARLFLSNGVWTFIQINTYEQMNSATPQFVRGYKKNNNGSTYTPDFTASSNLNKTEDGTNLQRLAGNTFDKLAILKEANLTYEMFGSYDLLPINVKRITTEGDITNAAVNNAIVAWNGYHTIGTGFETDGDIYGINDLVLANGNSIIKFELGEVTQVSGLTIRVIRKFNRAFDGTYTDFSNITGGTNTTVLFYHRLKLRSGGTTRYARSTYTSGGLAPWTSNNIFGNAPGYNSPYTFFGHSSLFNATPTNTFDLNFETAEIPFSGDLSFECYAKVYHSYGSNDPDTGTEVTTPADQEKFFIYSAPENAEEQLIQSYINGESTSKQIFRSTQDIKNGITYEVGEVFIGSGPSASNQGALESYNGSTFDEGTNMSWVAYGTGTGEKISNLLLNEIMKGQNDGASIFNGKIKILSNNVLTSGYKFENGITIDSKFYIPYQCTFLANEDIWDGEWYEINTGSPTLTNTIEQESLQTTTNNTSSTNSW